MADPRSRSEARDEEPGPAPRLRARRRLRDRAAVDPPAFLFNDALFAPPSTRIGAAEVFAVSPEMRRFIGNEMAFDLRTKGAQRGLIEALYTRGKLKLEYDSALTRNAADAFAARSRRSPSATSTTRTGGRARR